MDLSFENKKQLVLLGVRVPKNDYNKLKKISRKHKQRPARVAAAIITNVLNGEK